MILFISNTIEYNNQEKGDIDLTLQKLLKHKVCLLLFFKDCMHIYVRSMCCNSTILKIPYIIITHVLPS